VFLRGDRNIETGVAPGASSDGVLTFAQ